MNEFIEKGYNVITCAPDEDKDTIIKLNNLGISYRKYFLSRQGLNPFHDFKSFITIYKTIRKEKPDIVLSYTIKPVIYGSLAAFICGIKQYHSIITGIGYSMYDETLKQKIIGKIVRKLYRITLNYNKKVFFQNPDDLNYFLNRRIINDSSNTVLLNGSGVDLDYYYQCKPVFSPVKFLLISRLLKEKGILEFISAAEELKKKYQSAQFQIIGWADASPSRIDPQLINKMKEKGIIDFLGYKKDVRSYIKKCSIFVLPSYREGTPRTVLEAMSMGRAIITCDSPGCRETVMDGINGFLIPVKDSRVLGKTMEKFIKDPSLIQDMGKESRKIAEIKYDVIKVNKTIIKELSL